MKIMAKNAAKEAAKEETKEEKVETIATDKAKVTKGNPD